MPVRKVEGGYKWGKHGTVYPTREGAEKQAQAAYANGYQGDDDEWVPLAEPKPESKHTADFAGYYAPEKIGKSRCITPEGFLILKDTPIARTGEQLYSSHEIDGVEANGAGFITVARSEDEVFRTETLQSFEGKDFVIEHPPEGVDVTNWKNQTVGHVQNVRRGAGVEDDLIIADIVVKDPMAIEYVNKHLPDLSAGYRADYEQVEPGRAIQRNIIGNHVAAVKAGRAGARVAVRDHSTTVGDENMAKGSIMPALRAVLAAVGIKTEDAVRIETALQSPGLTLDADKEDEEEKEGFKKLANDMKAVKDWIRAKDEEAEAAKKKEEEEKEKAAKDSEASHKAGELVHAAMEAHEAVGDTIIEAEGPGGHVNLGKTWSGSMTGDSATPEPVLVAVNARAEILAPGFPKLTSDAIKGNSGKVLANHLRQALAKHAATPAGKNNVQSFLVGDSIENLKGRELVGVFNGVAQLARTRNNITARQVSAHVTDGKPEPVTPATLNERNRKYWKERANS